MLIEETTTLRQGLELYYSVNPEFQGGVDFLGMDGEVIKEHDAVHVVFGLGTTSREELLVEVITLLGCSVGVSNIKDSITHGFFWEVLKLFGPYRLVKRLILSLPDVFRTVLMCLRMKKKWPHAGYKQYLDTPLTNIREEFGIRTLSAIRPNIRT